MVVVPKTVVVAPDAKKSFAPGVLIIKLLETDNAF